MATESLPSEAEYRHILPRLTAQGITCHAEHFRQANRALLAGTPQQEITDPEVNTIVAYARRTNDELDALDDQRAHPGLRRSNFTPAADALSVARPGLRLGQLMQRLQSTGDPRLQAIVGRIRKIYGSAGREAVDEALVRGTGEFNLALLENLRPDPAAVTTLAEAVMLLRRIDSAVRRELEMPSNLSRVVSTLAPQHKVRLTPGEIVATGYKIVDALKAFLNVADALYPLFRDNPFFRAREFPGLPSLLKIGSIINFPVTGRLNGQSLPANLELDLHASEIIGSAACLNILKAPFIASSEASTVRRAFAHHGFPTVQPDPVRLLIALEQAELQLDDIEEPLFPHHKRVFVATSATFNITKFKAQPCFVVVEQGRARLGVLTREDAAGMRDGSVQVYSPLAVRLT